MSAFELARTDFTSYGMLQWLPFGPSAFHRKIIDRLEKVERGDIRRLAIIMPPQHGKTLCASVLFPPWYLGRHPDEHVVFATYSQDLADTIGRRVRNFCDSEIQRAIFPGSRLSRDSASISRFDLERGGSFTALGRGAGLSGRPAHLVIIDDVFKDRTECDCRFPG
jgi:hypothetical protein